MVLDDAYLQILPPDAGLYSAAGGISVNSDCDIFPPTRLFQSHSRVSATRGEELEGFPGKSWGVSGFVFFLGLSGRAEGW